MILLQGKSQKRFQFFHRKVFDSGMVHEFAQKKWEAYSEKTYKV